jgi:hypothetical protein
MVSGTSCEKKSVDDGLWTNPQNSFQFNSNPNGRYATRRYPAMGIAASPRPRTDRNLTGQDRALAGDDVPTDHERMSKPWRVRIDGRIRAVRPPTVCVHGYCSRARTRPTKRPLGILPAKHSVCVSGDDRRPPRHRRPRPIATAVLSENGTLQDPFVFVCEHARNMGRARHKYDIR